MVFADGLSAACGEAQYAVGRVGGAEKLHKTLTLLAELRPDALFVKLDFRNAYNSILRTSIREAVAARAPALDSVAATLCPVRTEHVWFDAEGRGRRVPAVRGVDQGCPLSPALFAIGVAPVLETLRSELRTRDGNAHVLSYLDDIHIVIAPQFAEAAVQRARELFVPLGLQLHDGKQKVWSPKPQELPPLASSLAISDTFTCLGASAIWVDEECARVDLAGQGTRLQRSFEALLAFSAQLIMLRTHGLSLAAALTVHRAWAGGTITHHMRSNLVSEIFAAQWDDAIAGFWAHELDRTLGPGERSQIHLPTRLAGCGVASASIARLPAFLGSWELCLSEVAHTLGANSAAQLRDSVRATATTIEGAAAGLRCRGVADYTFEWEEVYNEARRRRQHDLTKPLHAAVHNAMLAVLSPAEQADLRSAGGTGAGGFLEPQTTVAHMSDVHLRTALRRRLRLARPGFDVSLNTSAPSTHCQHRNAETGEICGRSLVEGTHDPARCDVGGVVLRFHHLLRDYMLDWVALHTGAPTLPEQIVDAWTRHEAPSPQHPEGRIRVARLDVAAFVGGRRTYIDVGYRSAATSNAEECQLRARTDGRAAAQYVAEKRRRYPPADNPGVGLVPFIIESLGRPSREAVAFLRALAPADPAKRAMVLAQAWQAISINTQTRLAEALISAELAQPPK